MAGDVEHHAAGDDTVGPVLDRAEAGAVEGDLLLRIAAVPHGLLVLAPPAPVAAFADVAKDFLFRGQRAFGHEDLRECGASRRAPVFRGAPSTTLLKRRER